MKNEQFHERAAKLLLGALSDCDKAVLPPESIRNLIDTIIDGNHKTYKYVLFTAITAKAANPALNPLALQKKADTWGAYDARSLCHKVLVPFERNYLNNALGGSNEPFLNKPARFEMLTPSNAVRNGNNRELLNLLCTTLPEITSESLAYSALSYLMRLLRAKAETVPKRFAETSMERGSVAIEVRSFLDRFLDYNYGGEVLTLSLAGILNEFLNEDSSYRIEVHNLNQSGASSREISDLDLYRYEKIFALFELKDKDFTISDVQHAVKKAVESGCDTLNFVYGKSVTFNREDVEQYRLSLTEDSFYLNVFSIEALIESLLTISPSLNLGRLINYMLDVASLCHFKEETSALLQKLGKEATANLGEDSISS